MTEDAVCSLHRFEERDIDLLLAEELRVNAAFAEWFMSRVAPGLWLAIPALRTRVSVVDDGNEADVVACFYDLHGGIHRLYVEDKITAGFQPDQLARYVRRAEAEQARSETSGWSVVLFAPRNYRADLPDRVVWISFEEAADALRTLSPGLRSEYRASLLERAVPYTTTADRDRHTAEVEAYVAAWWDEVYRMLEREFPGFFLPARTRYPRSVFFAPETGGMPKYLRVDLKGHKGKVDLAFKDVSYNDLRTRLAGLDLPGRLVENGRSTAIRVSGLEPFRIADGIGVIETWVRSAYAAAHKLLEFGLASQSRFDDLR